MSKAAKRKLMRSGTQVCPISGYRGRLVKHHINGRDVKNADGEWNVVWVSPTVHDEIHTGRIVIEAWFMTSTGRELIWRRVEDISITGEESAPKGYDGLPL